METILKTIDQYDIFNNFIPGAAYIFLVNQLYGKELTEGILDFLVASYIVGIIVSRFGSIAVEWIIKDKLKLVEPPVKNEFIDAEIKDPLKKITKLNMVATMYRSLLSAVIMAGFTGLWIVVRTYIPVIKTFENTVIIILLVILFTLSYRKQTNYVRNRVNKVNANYPDEQNKTTSETQDKCKKTEINRQEIADESDNSVILKT
ncbi:MAG: hypothetical protein LUE25_06830 [Clostridiales bacterium]|nr:hypothetical protein [Clostridiales bacterium]